MRTRAQSAPLSPSVYLGVEPDGTVFIVTHRSEMGTGIRTSLPLVAADELDADWSRVRIEQGLGDPKYGDQNTDGSRSIRDFYDAFRRAGASARVMLVSAAAAQWGVPATECAAQNHEVVHRPSGRRWRLARWCPPPPSCRCPAAETLRFKPKTEWKFVGQERPIYDLADITTGKAPFGLDIYRDNMVVASIEHPPVVGGTVKSVVDAETREGARRARRDHARPAEAAADVPVARRRGGDRRQHLGGAEGPARAEGRVERRRRTRTFESERVQETAGADGQPAGQGGPQPRQRGRRVRQGRQGARGHLLHADAGARLDGAAGGGGRLPERQGRRCGRRRRTRRRRRKPWPRRWASTRRTSPAT